MTFNPVVDSLNAFSATVASEPPSLVRDSTLYVDHSIGTHVIISRTVETGHTREIIPPKFVAVPLPCTVSRPLQGNELCIQVLGLSLALQPFQLLPLELFLLLSGLFFRKPRPLFLFQLRACQ